MTLAEWCACASADLKRRNLPDMLPIVEALMRATAVLRDATWNADATGRDIQRTASDAR